MGISRSTKELLPVCVLTCIHLVTFGDDISGQRSMGIFPFNYLLLWMCGLSTLDHRHHDHKSHHTAQSPTSQLSPECTHQPECEPNFERYPSFGTLEVLYGDLLRVLL